MLHCATLTHVHAISRAQVFPVIQFHYLQHPWQYCLLYFLLYFFFGRENFIRYMQTIHMHKKHFFPLLYPTSTETKSFKSQKAQRYHKLKILHSWAMTPNDDGGLYRFFFLFFAFLSLYSLTSLLNRWWLFVVVQEKNGKYILMKRKKIIEKASGTCFEYKFQSLLCGWLSFTNIFLRDFCLMFAFLGFLLQSNNC